MFQIVALKLSSSAPNNREQESIAQNSKTSNTKHYFSTIDTRNFLYSRRSSFAGGFCFFFMMFHEHHSSLQGIRCRRDITHVTMLYSVDFLSRVMLMI